MAYIMGLLLASLHLFVNVSGRTAVSFIFYSDRRQWSAAEAICVQNGGQLANIEDNETLNALRFFAKTTQWQRNVTEYFWTGLHKSSKESPYKWSNCTNLTTLSFWGEPDIVDHFDTACVRADHISLQWFPSSCDDNLQYVCQFVSGPCTYDSYGYGECSPSHVTRVTVSEETESECQRSCDTAVNEQGNQCWAYYFLSSAHSCSLLHSSDPYFCDSGDNSSDTLLRRLKIRSCFNFDVNQTKEWADSSVTPDLLDCSENKSQETTSEGEWNMAGDETTESGTEAFANTETEARTEVGTGTVVESTTSVESIIEVESNIGVHADTGLESNVGVHSDTGLESNVGGDTTMTAGTDSNTGTESNAGIDSKIITPEKERGSLQIMTYSFSSVSAYMSVPVAATGLPYTLSSGLDQDVLSQSSDCTECPENTIIASPHGTSELQDISPSPSVQLFQSFPTGTENEASNYFPEHNFLTSQRSLDDNEEYPGVRSTDIVFFTPSEGIFMGSSGWAPEFKSYNVYSSDSLYSQQIEQFEATTKVNLPVTSVTPQATRTRHIMCTCVKCSSRANDSSVEELLVKHLKIDKALLSSTRRKLTTASDNRRSAQAIGYVGVVFVSLTMWCMILSDIMTLLSQQSSHMRVESINA